MNNSNVAHTFAYRKDGKGSSFESRNNILWSYDSVLAVKRDDNVIVVSNPIATYSNSSAKHHGHLRSATIHMKKVYVNREIGNGVLLQSDFNDKIVKIRDLLVKQSRARRINYFNEIERELEEIELILERVKIDKRSTYYKEYKKYRDIDVLKENYKDLIKKAISEDERERKRKIANAYKKRLEKVENFTGCSMKNYTKAEISSMDFLTIHEDTLKTSQGLHVPLREAKALYRAYKMGKSIVGQKIRGYTIIKVDKKAVQIGCHNVPMTEFERLFEGYDEGTMNTNKKGYKEDTL